MNPKYSDSNRIPWIKSKSGFSRWDSIKLFWTSSFRCKNSTRKIRYVLVNLLAPFLPQDEVEFVNVSRFCVNFTGKEKEREEGNLQQLLSCFLQLNSFDAKL